MGDCHVLDHHINGWLMSWVTTLMGDCYVLGHHIDGWLSCPGSPHWWVTVMSWVTTLMGDCQVLGQQMDGWVSCTRSPHRWVTVMSWVTTLVGVCHVLGHHKEGWLSCPGLRHGWVTTWLDTTWLGTTGHNMAGWLSCPRSPHGWVTVISRVTTQMGDCHVLGHHMDRWLSYPGLCTHTQISSELNSVQTANVLLMRLLFMLMGPGLSFFPFFGGVCRAWVCVGMPEAGNELGSGIQMPEENCQIRWLPKKIKKIKIKIKSNQVIVQGREVRQDYYLCSQTNRVLFLAWAVVFCRHSACQSVYSFRLCCFEIWVEQTFRPLWCAPEQISKVKK